MSNVYKIVDANGNMVNFAGVQCDAGCYFTQSEATKIAAYLQENKKSNFEVVQTDIVIQGNIPTPDPTIYNAIELEPKLKWAEYILVDGKELFLNADGKYVSDMDQAVWSEGSRKDFKQVSRNNINKNYTVQKV